jgi:hypothetical protein
VGDPAQHPRLCWIWPQATGDSFAEGANKCVAGAEVAANIGDHAAESFMLATAAIYRLAAGNERVAIEHAERALVLARAVGSRSLQARAAGALAYALQDVDAAAARRAAADVLDVADPGDFHLNMPHRVLAILAWREGNYATAAAHAAEAALLIRDQGDRYVQAASITQFAVLLGEYDPALAAELLGVADAIVPQIRVIARDQMAQANLRAALGKALGPDEFRACLARGKRHDARGAYATVERGLQRMASRT